MRTLARLFAASALALALAVPSLSKEPFWAQVTYLKGSASVTLAGSSDAQPLRRGTVLHRGDLVKTGEGSQVSLLLHDGGVVVVRASSDLVLGKAQAAEGPDLKAVAGNLSKTLMAREGDNPMLKHLGGLRGTDRNLALAPCRTKVRRDGLRLQWSPRAGVSKYDVTLMGPDDSLAEFSTSETQVAIAADRLSPGGIYYWEVRDAAARDSLSILGSGTFTALDKKAEGEVRSLEASIRSAYPSGGEDTTPQFLAYQLYRERGLNLDALWSLNGMLAAEPADPELQRLRSELCREMGISEAEAAKLTAAP